MDKKKIYKSILKKSVFICVHLWLKNFIKISKLRYESKQPQYFRAKHFEICR
jgi:hypothetical protein